MVGGTWGKLAAAAGVIIGLRAVGKQLGIVGLGWDNDAALQWFRDISDRLGIWAMPAYIGVHTLTLALCLPYAVFFEAGASMLFGFVPAVLCVFSAKILGASLSFWIGRFLFRISSSTSDWARKNKYFNLLSHGVAQDGWKFVLLARFSPIPSYVINYALAATEVRFLVDFLLPTVIGCLPMILQNTSIGSLASVAVSSASSSGSPSSATKKSQIWSYLLPLLGIVSSVLISMRIKKYSSNILASETSSASKDSDGSTRRPSKIKSK
ncbi:OLC1v1028794C1 [Oldenlandia corymbosa var. corymbosa]|uniref:OLC1v1028794C1 n=1 Tax=Oldenlandia corymbosa var. corymbosa TaxID=529605 RepID=A0AAV1CDC5_OLDCO|nr:OLC1v1028794C1 [Oldenlandia corymbosa var. corymbosa]